MKRKNRNALRRSTILALPKKRGAKPAKEEGIPAALPMDGPAAVTGILLAI